MITEDYIAWTVIVGLISIVFLLVAMSMGTIEWQTGIICFLFFLIQAIIGGQTK